MKRLLKNSKNKRSAVCRSIFAAVSAVILLTLCFPAKAAGMEATAQKTVRVACGINNVLYLDDNGNPGGCCAEYLEELSKINNWKLEYVDDSWTNCYNKFLNGEIDLLLPLQRTPEREELMSFSELDVGYQIIGLFAPADSDICYEEFDAFEGKHIAVTPQSINDSMLREYAQKNGFSYVRDYLKSADEKLDAIKSGETDLVVFSTVNDVKNLKLVGTIQTLPFYMAVSKENPELLSELNYGMEKLLIDENELVNATRNSTVNTGAEVAFTRQEMNYILSSEKVVIGFYDDTAPLAGIHKEDGEYHGIYVEVLRRMAEETGLNIELYPISRDIYGLDLVRDGTIDFLIGASEGAITALNEDDLMATKSVMDYNTVAVSKRNFQFNSETHMKFALTSARRYWEEYIFSKFPNATIKYFESAKDCLDAIEGGKADVTLLNTIEYNYQSKNPRFSGLIEWE